MISLISAIATPASFRGPGFAVQTISAVTALRLRAAPEPAVKDTASVATGTRFATDAGAIARASGNAREGATALQIAEQGLAAIAEDLKQMKALAKQAASTHALTQVSDGERAILNAEFANLRVDIDRIADQTKFNEIKVLKGGQTIDGANALQLTIKVGTGTASQDDITFTVKAATVADLSAGLASDDIASAASASQALTNATAAADKVADIRAAVSGSAERLAEAAQDLTADSDILKQTDLGVPQPGGQVDLARSLSQQLLTDSAPFISAQSFTALRAVLLNPRLSTEPPAPTPRPEPVQTRQVPRAAPAADPAERAIEDNDEKAGDEKAGAEKAGDEKAEAASREAGPAFRKAGPRHDAAAAGRAGSASGKAASSAPASDTTA